MESYEYVIDETVVRGNTIWRIYQNRPIISGHRCTGLYREYLDDLYLDKQDAIKRLTEITTAHSARRD